MFPIRDHNPSSRTPYVTIGLIALNLLIYVLTERWGGDMLRLWVENALYPLAITEGTRLPALVTHMFLHGGLLHILGNMLFLWVFGDNMEDQMGHVGFLVFYLACGVLAALAQVVTDPYSTVPMVGASGAIAGVMGGYLLMFPRARIDVIAIIIILIRRFVVPAWVILLVWFGLQLVMGLVSGADSGVAYWAHNGGFVAGILLTLPLFLRRGGRAFWNQTRGHPPHPASAFRTSHIPVVRRDDRGAGQG